MYVDKICLKKEKAFHLSILHASLYTEITYYIEVWCV